MNKLTKDMLRTGDRVTCKNGLRFYVCIGGTTNTKEGYTTDMLVSTDSGWDALESYSSNLINTCDDYYTITKVERNERPFAWIYYLNTICKWVTIWERKEKPRVTQEEIEAFKAIKVLYPEMRYIARDDDGSVVAYIDRPIKNDLKDWFGDCRWFILFEDDNSFGRDIYPSIKWEDDEPIDMDAEIARAEGDNK